MIILPIFFNSRGLQEKVENVANTTTKASHKENPKSGQIPGLTMELLRVIEVSHSAHGLDHG